MAILDFVQTYLRCDFLDMAMPIITWLGNGGILWIVCSLLLTAYPRIRKAGIAMAVSGTMLQCGTEAVCGEGAAL